MLRVAVRGTPFRAPPAAFVETRGFAGAVRDFRGEEEVRAPEEDRARADEPPVRPPWIGDALRPLREAPRCDDCCDAMG